MPDEHSGELGYIAGVILLVYYLFRLITGTVIFVDGDCSYLSRV